jgi:hypothetical protein
METRKEAMETRKRKPLRPEKRKPWCLVKSLESRKKSWRPEKRKFLCRERSLETRIEALEARKKESSGVRKEARRPEMRPWRPGRKKALVSVKEVRILERRP